MKTIFLLVATWLPILAFSQQLFFEGFGALNRTAYDAAPYEATKSYYAGGFRLAGGSDHVQVGGEFRTNLTNPEFGSTLTTAFEETYMGALIRAKISRYPAMRFGLVLKAGAGLYNTKAIVGTGIGNLEYEYDQILGFNGGVGFSIPMMNKLMLELGYQYNYVDRPDLEAGGIPIIGAHNGAYHSIQAGLSLNFVFGKRAKDYQHLRENWKWRNGWRG